jgi:hypothetical protein
MQGTTDLEHAAFVPHDELDDLENERDGVADDTRWPKCVTCASASR